MRTIEQGRATPGEVAEALAANHGRHQHPSALKGSDMNPPIQVSRPWWQRLPPTIDLAALRAWYRGLQRRARQHRELRALDAGALRDLGVDRSELASYETESDGLALHTRRRVAPRMLRTMEPT
jgi:uncharacterized protein YjiS (DUF1127 family)